MNPRELVDHIRSGPSELLLNKPLRFRRRTRSNPCDFKEFLQALQSSETIRDVQCGSQQLLEITEDEWGLLVNTLGSIKDIQRLEVSCKRGSRDFRPFQAVADAINSAQSLFRLAIYLDGATIPSDPSGMIALAGALREHTTLQIFTWIDSWFMQEVETQDVIADPVLRALPECPHLRDVTIITKSASTDATNSLLQLHSATVLNLVLKTTEHWLAMADEIRLGRCYLKKLTLCMVQTSRSETTEAVKALANAIRLDHNLEHLTLTMESGCTDEAGVALAEALTVNRTLRNIALFVTPVFNGARFFNTYALGACAYEAFGAMLRGNTDLVLTVPPLRSPFRDHRLLESRTQMIIEQRLNEVGRGYLLASSSDTTKEDWVMALHKLSTYNISPSFEVSCVYSLLRLNPEICILKVDATSE
jgi:hypothetical protein